MKKINGDDEESTRASLVKSKTRRVGLLENLTRGKWKKCRKLKILCNELGARAFFAKMMIVLLAERKARETMKPVKQYIHSQ